MKDEPVERRLIAAVGDPPGPETLAGFYSAKCRAVVDAVLSRYAQIEDSADEQTASDGWAWLEAQLTLATATVGTVAELVLRVAPPPPSAEPVTTLLRAVAWIRLGAPAEASWSRGPESACAWSLLMCPAPANPHDEWWLATIHRLTTVQLSGLTLGRTRLAPSPPPPRRRAPNRR